MKINTVQTMLITINKVLEWQGEKELFIFWYDGFGFGSQYVVL